MPISARDRSRAFRARCKAEGRPDHDKEKARVYKKRYKVWSEKPERPFCGCDGEGAGTDEKGRQRYLLFRMGERELFKHGDRLETRELLDFICDHPAGEILVGFAFGYDVTMILMDLPESQKKHIVAKKALGPGVSRFTWYKEFDIEYLPKQYFRVRRVRIERGPDGREKRTVVKGSTRTIYETFGFFQKSFVKVIDEFGVGTSDGRLAIAKDKERRADFGTIGQRERDYCRLEVQYLAELMEKLRGYCSDANIKPRSWNGAGKLAGALHRDHQTLESSAIAGLVPASVIELSNMAYYGGRFEITRTGLIREKVYEYDIRSAYPAAMRSLPCLHHGEWKECTGAELRAISRGLDRRYGSDPLFVAGVTFKAADPARTFLGGLPIRSPEGHLYWPAQGGGIYWSCEIMSAIRLGQDVSFKSGWLYEKRCDCRPFEWVEQLYEYRRSIGSAGPGYPIKLGINSLYGLLAQRVGAGKFTNLIWAGLITAITRAKLNDAAIQAGPENVVMLATDAVYSTVPIGGLVEGPRLGEWEATVLDGLFIVQPGLYWCPAKRKRKSRGLSGKFFETPGMTEGFEATWERWRQEQNSKLDTPFPEVSVPVPGFIGLKLAMARNKPDQAGCWIEDQRVISFDYRNKRQGHRWDGDAIITGIKAGRPGLVSLPHKDFLAAGGQEPWENARLMLDEQPDYVDLGIPFKD